MPRGPAIPLEIQDQVQKLVEEFNHKNFSNPSPLLKLLPDRFLLDKNLETFMLRVSKVKSFFSIELSLAQNQHLSAG